MFSDWTDPYDIDNYYNDLNGIFKNTQEEPSSNTIQQSKYYEMPSRHQIISAPEQPTGPIVNTLVDVAQTPKNSFEVQPNTMFSDGHMVGHQPSYNILQSGPPGPVPAPVPTFKETYWNSPIQQFDWIHIVAFFIVIVLVGFLAQAYSQISNTNATVHLLVSLLMNQQHK